MRAGLEKKGLRHASHRHSDWAPRLPRKPVIAVGSVTLNNEFKLPLDKIYAEAAPSSAAHLGKPLPAEHFDLIAIGFSLLANPD